MDIKQNLHFHIVFSQSWILKQRGSKVLPIDWLVSEIKKQYNVSGVKTKISECEGYIEMTSPADEEELQNKLNELILDEYNLDAASNIFTVEVNVCDKESTKAEEPAPKHNEQPVPQKAMASIPRNESKAAEGSDPLDEINKLVGAAEFKSLAQECAKIAPALKRNDTVDSFTSRTYLVSVNSGYGLTTYLELFADLISSLGLFEFTSRTRVVEVELPSSGDAFNDALSYFKGKSGGKIICIDISEWMTKTDDKKFRDFLRSIDDNIGKNIVFFRIPFVEKNIIDNVHADLNDMLFIKDISIPPFSVDELVKCAENIITQKNFTMTDDAWDIFTSRIAIEKSDGKFYGINTLKKIIREMLYTKQLYNIENGVDDTVIKRGEINSLADKYSINTKSGFEQLSELIGMESLIDRIQEVVAQIELSVQNESIDTPCIHMRFVGNPGTGKTTVARILGTILKEKGILRNGNFFEHAGRDLCGRYVGETAPKTAAICRDAYGSVLFIDEAYSLYRDEGFSTADYGREAIDTLVAEMENHRTDLMVIMAGYPDEMDKMMNGNVGLKSRMPYLIEFPNYTRGQLAEIFMTMVNKGFKYDDAFADAVKAYFLSLDTELMEAKDFSNARFVRNLFERTWGKAALRCQMNQTPCDTLTVEDLALATSDKEFHNIMVQKKRKIGF